jgi:hypothetical protein
MAVTPTSTSFGSGLADIFFFLDPSSVEDFFLEVFPSAL